MYQLKHVKFWQANKKTIFTVNSIDQFHLSSLLVTLTSLELMHQKIFPTKCVKTNFSLVWISYNAYLPFFLCISHITDDIIKHN